MKRFFLISLSCAAVFLSCAFLSLLGSCATTPKGRAQQTAVTQKATVDGTGYAYLSYCKIVRRPQCMDQDESAVEAGVPQSQSDRVACLRPCDSATAAKIQDGVDIVRTAQTALFHLLKQEDVTKEELEASRAQLRRASSQLLDLLQEHGVMKLLNNAVGE